MTWLIDCRFACCLLIATVLVTLQPEHKSALLCSIFGLMGGGIAQLLTYDDRKPKIKYIVGDMLSSGVFGMGTYVYLKASTVDVLFYSILAGSAGSGMFLVLVKKFKPNWLDGLADGGDGHDKSK